MPLTNADVAEVFDEIADLLEIQAANEFRVRAYRNASRVVRGWPTRLSAHITDGKELPKLPGLGKDLTAKVVEFVKSRRLAMLEDLRKKTPPGLLELLKLPGIGPKRIARLQAELKINSIATLGKALESGRLEELEGFGPKIKERLKAELEKIKNKTGGPEGRMSLAHAGQIAEPLLAYLRESRAAIQVIAAGSFRRGLETIGDLDILVSTRTAAASEKITRHFLAYEEVAEVRAQGTTRSTVILKSGVQVDLRVVGEASYGAALHYFTGSKAHNIAIRMLGMKRGLKINEYGVFRGSSRVSGRTENEVFASVDLPYIEPELRENRGEIDASRDHGLPKLVTLDQIRGDLHSHTKETDGRNTIHEMALEAKRLGYEYLAITDHSKRLTVASGLDVRRLGAQIREIDRLNERFSDEGIGIQILKSIEVDILEDGRLDLPDSILSRLDLTVCSIHSYFTLSPKKQLERLIRAMDNPYFNILGHPSGRLIGRREPRARMDFDIEKLILAARDRGCFLEINAQPERMDLDDTHCRLAKEMGVKLVISTDSHSEHDLVSMKYGVLQARRGWLEAGDIVNTRSWAEVQALLRRPQGGSRDAKKAA